MGFHSKDSNELQITVVEKWFSFLVFSQIVNGPSHHSLKEQFDRPSWTNTRDSLRKKKEQMDTSTGDWSGRVSMKERVKGDTGVDSTCSVRRGRTPSTCRNPHTKQDKVYQHLPCPSTCPSSVHQLFRTCSLLRTKKKKRKITVKYQYILRHHVSLQYYIHMSHFTNLVD